MTDFENLVKIATNAHFGVIDYYKKLGLQYVDVPAIVGITGACENVDTLFKVGNRLDIPLFFTQTGQLALEQALQYFPGVCTVINSGRDEEEEDVRHLRQFRLTEEEFDCTFAGMTRENYNEEKMYETLLTHIEKATKAMIGSVGMNKNRRDILTRPYLRTNYEEAIGLLNHSGYPDLKFGDDLKADHEAKLVEILNLRSKDYGTKIEHWSPLLICRYPKEIKFFNMKVSQKDPRVVLSADCIFPFAGEAVGAAVREHDGIKLIVRLLTSTMYKLHEQRGGKYEDFQWYTEGMIAKGKTNPHAGYGIGNERVLQFILGRHDIRPCSVFYLMNIQTKDWDSSRRNLAQVVSHRKTILLSIGQEENKKSLLPHLQRIKNDGHLFYATEKTHKFLEAHGIPTARVYKVSEEGTPNLRDLLQNNTLDLVINIPTSFNRSLEEKTDGQFIRQKAIETGTTLITDSSLAQSLFANLVKTSRGNSN